MTGCLLTDISIQYPEDQPGGLVRVESERQLRSQLQRLANQSPRIVLLTSKYGEMMIAIGGPLAGAFFGKPPLSAPSMWAVPDEPQPEAQLYEEQGFNNGGGGATFAYDRGKLLP